MFDHIQEQANYSIPMVIEQTARGERSFDIYSRLKRKNYFLIWSSQRHYLFFGICAVIILESEEKRYLSLH